MSIRTMLAVLAGCALLPVSPALALVSQSYVSKTGSDSNSCTISLPCASFFKALDNTVPNGEVLILDPAVIDEVIIDKPVTIRAIGGNATRFGFIEIAAGASDKVELDGIDLYGGPTGIADIGVYITSAGDVTIRNCHIRGFQTASPHGVGGIVLDNMAGPVKVLVENSFVSNNTYGIQINSAPGMGHVKLLNSTLASNPSAGIQVNGAGNDVLIARSQILGSVKALDLKSGATATSYGDNVITNGDAPAKVPLN
jgi:hypothetical protein